VATKKELTLFNGFRKTKRRFEWQGNKFQPLFGYQLPRPSGRGQEGLTYMGFSPNKDLFCLHYSTA
jgi:hypothetical protein